MARVASLEECSREELDMLYAGLVLLEQVLKVNLLAVYEDGDRDRVLLQVAKVRQMLREIQTVL